MQVSFKSGISIWLHCCKALLGFTLAISFISSKFSVEIKEEGSAVLGQSATQLSCSSSSQILFPQQGTIGLFAHTLFSIASMVHRLLSSQSKLCFSVSLFVIILNYYSQYIISCFSVFRN